MYDSEETNTLGLSWGNSALSVHYRDRLGDNGIVDATLGHSRFTSDLFALGGGSAVYLNGERVEYTPPMDTLLFGDGIMSETRADLRVTWRTGRATITSAAQATRFLGQHDYDHSDEFDSDEGFFFSPLTLRESSWRLAAYSTVEVPLQRGFSTRAGLRVDHFRRLATTLAPFAELSYAASWWDARISASRSHQALASVRDEEALGASFLAYDLLVPVSEAPVPRNTEFTIGWEGSRAGGPGPGGRLCAHPGQPQTARARRQAGHRRRVGGSVAMGGFQRFGKGDRDILELDHGRGIFGAGELPLGPGVEDRGFADLQAPLPPEPRIRTGDLLRARRVVVVRACIIALGTTDHAGAGDGAH